MGAQVSPPLMRTPLSEEKGESCSMYEAVVLPLSSCSCGSLRSCWWAARPHRGRHTGGARTRGQRGLLILAICGQESVGLPSSGKYGEMLRLSDTPLESGVKGPGIMVRSRGIRGTQVEKTGGETAGGVQGRGREGICTQQSGQHLKHHGRQVGLVLAPAPQAAAGHTRGPDWAGRTGR